MKIKTSELTGRALDWAVAQCEYKTASPDEYFEFSHAPYVRDYETGNRIPFTPSTDWSQGWPIIEREGISLHHKWYNGEWHATKQVDPSHPTLPGRLHQITRWHPSNPLIAAMRCFVASKLGDEVEVPDEVA